MEGKVLLGNVVIAMRMQLRPVSSYIRSQLLAGEMVQLPAESDKGSETYNGTWIVPECAIVRSSCREPQEQNTDL